MPRAISINAQALRAQASGEAQVPERVMIPQGGLNGCDLFKPAHIGDGLGLKIVGVRPNNKAKGLPTVPAVVMLVDLGRELAAQFHRYAGALFCFCDATIIIILIINTIICLVFALQKLRCPHALWEPPT